MNDRDLKDAQRLEAPTLVDAPTGVDLVAVYRAVQRALVYLQEAEYTVPHVRQADVREHDDLPDRASDADTARG